LQLTLHYRQVAKEIRGVREGGNGRREGGAGPGSRNRSTQQFPEITTITTILIFNGDVELDEKLRRMDGMDGTDAWLYLYLLLSYFVFPWVVLPVLKA
jgi:hypothetical protein